MNPDNLFKNLLLSRPLKNWLFIKSRFKILILFYNCAIMFRIMGVKVERERQTEPVTLRQTPQIQIFFQFLNQNRFLNILRRFALKWISQTFSKILRLSVSQSSELRKSLFNNFLARFSIFRNFFKNVLEYQNGSKFARGPNLTYSTIWIKKTWGSEKVGNSLFLGPFI